MILCFFCDREAEYWGQFPDQPIFCFCKKHYEALKNCTLKDYRSWGEIADNLFDENDLEKHNELRVK